MNRNELLMKILDKANYIKSIKKTFKNVLETSLSTNNIEFSTANKNRILGTVLPQLLIDKFMNSAVDIYGKPFSDVELEMILNEDPNIGHSLIERVVNVTAELNAFTKTQIISLIPGLNISWQKMLMENNANGESNE